MNTTSGTQSKTVSSSSDLPFDPSGARFDFDFDPLVDADDPGFASEFDVTDSEHSFCNDNDDEQASDVDDFAAADTKLRVLTRSLQASFLNQPKSTQLILTHEVSELFKTYQGHGSAARLSASILEYLDGGDVVSRNVERDVIEEEIDADGARTGRKRTVKKLVSEKAKLRFEAVGGEPANRLSKGKRKAEVEVGGAEKRERLDGVDTAGDVDADASLELSRRGSPVLMRHRTAGEMFPGNDRSGGIANVGVVGLPLQPDQQRHQFDRVLNPPGTPNQYPTTHPTGHHHPSTASSRQPPLTNTPATLSLQKHNTPHTHPTSTRNHPLTNLPIPPNQYSLTTSPTTQSRFLGLHPEIPFRPLEHLKIPFPITPSTPLSTIEPLPNILNLHSHATLKFHDSLIDKYTRPHVQPPAALIRLALTTRLHNDLKQLFTPAQRSEFAIGPEARAVFKDVYERFARGGLNAVEEEVLARSTGTDAEGVEGWWRHRVKSETPWIALRMWIERVEGLEIREAKIQGRF